jgi:hypothetical protein
MNIQLPGRIEYLVNAYDRAIYLGTIRYHRDGYNGITKVDSIDDVERANREYVKRFGEQIRLRRAVPQAVKQLQVNGGGERTLTAR